MAENIYYITSILDIVITLAVLFGGFFVLRSSIGKATSEAQQSAITAMQSELDTLRGRTDDLKQENTRLQHILQTICKALEIKGMIVAITGDLVHIKDSSGSTSTRIQEHEA